MKKIYCLIMCLVISTNLIACSSKPVNSEKVNGNSNVEQNNNEDSKETVKDKADETNNNNIQSTTTTTTSENKTSSENKNIITQESKAKGVTNDKSVQQVTPQPAVQTKGNKVIVIDPGHANRSNLEKEPLAPGSSELKIKDGGGAQGIATKTPEYRVNMNVSMKLKDILQGKGYTVVMTKTQDSQSLGNVERANIWNAANAALVLRIHADSSDNSSVKGASMLVPSPINNDTKAIYAASKSYGKTVLDTLVNEVGMPNRGVVEHNDMTGFNWTKVPVILVEMGFLSNPDEDKLLSNDAYENKLAKALADGITAAVK